MFCNMLPENLFTTIFSVERTACMQGYGQLQFVKYSGLWDTDAALYKLS